MLPVEIVVCAARDGGRDKIRKPYKRHSKATDAGELQLRRYDLRRRKPLTGNMRHFPFNMLVPPLIS
jgi:hypothetical protein